MLLKKFSIFLVLALITLKGCEWALIHCLPRHFIFDQKHLQSIVKDSIDSLSIDATAEEIMTSVHSKLKESYPGYINDLRPEDWVFNNAGNSMGTMIILHASFSEYLIFFGSAIGAGGHSGVHFADDYFIIMYGEELAALPNATKPERYLPGDVHHLPYGVAKHYAMPAGSFALELAQGYIPSMLPFGFVEVVSSTLDIQNFGKTAWITGRDMIRNMLKGKL